MQDLELEGLLRQLKLVDIRENCDDLVSCKWRIPSVCFAEQNGRDA